MSGKRANVPFVLRDSANRLVRDLCTYLHPASAILRAYILPISPIPMIPTTASPILAVGEPRAQHTCLTQTKADGRWDALRSVRVQM